MKKNEEEKKATIVILGTLIILVLIIIIPLAFLSKKSEKNDSKFPGYEYIDITQEKLSDKEKYNEIKTSLEGNSLFKRIVLIDNYNYEEYNRFNVEGMIKGYIFAYEPSNKKYFMYSDTDEEKYSDYLDSFKIQGIIKKYSKELYNIDITKKIDDFLVYSKYMTEGKDTYCFSFRTISNEYNNDIKLNITALSMSNDDIVTAKIYVYTYYTMGTDSEKEKVKRLEESIKNNNNSLSNSIVYNELNGRVVQKELNFKVLKSGKFFKYQVLNIKTLDN